MDFSKNHSSPYVLGVLQDYPLYRQIYEGKKDTHYFLTQVQRNALQLKEPLYTKIRMYKIELPEGYLQ